MATCRVCERAATEDLVDAGNRARVDCPACGCYEIPIHVPAQVLTRPELRARLSHKIRRMQRAGERPVVDRELAAKLVSEPLPSAQEQADNLILWLGDRLRETNPLGQVEFTATASSECCATIGGYNDGAIGFLGDQLQKEGLLIWAHLFTHLTLRGWEKYETIKKGAVSSHLAFMAMPFGKAELDGVFESSFKPAAAKAGFDLRRLDENKQAGILDNRMRVDIRIARFVVAELTDQNPNVYWEAAFAEGLNKPVIYSCRREYFDRHRTAFDVNHSQTVLWIDSEEGLRQAADELKAIIRNTFPSEAKLRDD